MPENPFRSPQEPSQVAHCSNTIHWQTFSGSKFTLFVTSERIREGVRQQAKYAIDAQIGAANVISIIENYVWPFSVTIWYHSKHGSPSLPTVSCR
ncbi:MAG: hypothetical protein KDB27_32685 [Planctomycetales bacterium]|nr:hypothetical protein [Planctomycetales bacterium]